MEFMNNHNLRILYLAKYAPNSSKEKIPENIEDTIYAVYHHKIYEVLSQEFQNIISTNNIQSIVEKRPAVDYIFSLYNRIPFRNSEIFLSSLAEYYNIPYLGAPPNVRAVAEDKHLAKINANYVGIDTPEWIICTHNHKIEKIPFDGPYFIKPRFGASSYGIDDQCFCQTITDIKSKLKEYQKHNIDVIIEKYISGTPITVPVLNNFGQTKVLPLIIENSNLPHNIITYKQKRKIETGLSRIVNKDCNLQSILNKIAKKYFDSIQPLDYTRMDFIIDSNTNKPYFIEFNVCCNLGEHAAINLSAKSIGIDYTSLISNIVYSSLYRQNLIRDTCGKKL